MKWFYRKINTLKYCVNWIYTYILAGDIHFIQYHFLQYSNFCQQKFGQLKQQQK